MSSRDTAIYRRDAASSGSLLSVKEREALVRKYLPVRDDARISPNDGQVGGGQQQQRDPTTTTASPRKPRRKPIRTFLKNSIYFFVFALIQLFFGIYIRLRRARRGLKTLVLKVLYHHHRTPELIAHDVAGLTRLPQHLSVLLELPMEKEEGGGGAVGKAARRAMRRRLRNRRKRRHEHFGAAIEGHGFGIELEALLDDVAELAAWSAAAGIPVLSVYERRGVLKEMAPAVHAAVRARLESYFGPRKAPTLQVRAPHVPSYLNGAGAGAGANGDDDDDENSQERRTREIGEGEKHFEYDSPAGGISDYDGEDDEEEVVVGADGEMVAEPRGHLDLLLLSENDGRATLIDLTKTLAEMGQKGRLSPRDVGLELLDQELSDSYSASDPDLLMLFGDRIVLQGYPPWQLRLTEIFCAGEGTGGAVDYPTWLRGLYRFAKAEMRLGR